MNFLKNKSDTVLANKRPLSDTNLLLVITIAVFVAMYLCAVVFLGSGFRKPQTFFNLLNENASLIVLSCALSLVMITGGIDISVGMVTALVCMSCAVNLDYHGGSIGSAIAIALIIGVGIGLVQGFGDLGKCLVHQLFGLLCGILRGHHPHGDGLRRVIHCLL